MYAHQPFATKKKEGLSMYDLVSIIMPSYNTCNFIAEAIESVLAQTYPYWELIIVDDCSTDDTNKFIEKYLKDQRIVYLQNEKNSGAAISRNRALKKAKGKWIAFLDSDDVWMPDKLSKQIDFMLKTNCSFSYTQYEEIDENSKSLGIIVTGPKKITKCGMYNYCWPGCLTVMYDKTVVGDIQIIDIKKNNDYAMWLKICKKTDCYLYEKVMAQYRKRMGSISNQKYRKLIKWHYIMFKDADNRGIFISIIFTIRNIFFGIIKKKKFILRKQ